MPGQNLPVAVVLVACVASIGYLQHGVQLLFHGEVSILKSRFNKPIFSLIIVLIFLEKEGCEGYIRLSNGEKRSAAEGICQELKIVSAIMT